MGQAEHDSLAVDIELGVDGVAVARGDAVPHVREAALVGLAGELRGHVKNPDKRAHLADVGERRSKFRFFSLFVEFRWHSLDLAGFLSGRGWWRASLFIG